MLEIKGKLKIYLLIYLKWVWLNHCHLTYLIFAIKNEVRGVALIYHSVQFSSVQSLSRVRLFAIPWTAARQASLSITNSRSPPKPTSIESVTPSNHLILCCPLLLLPSIFPSIRVFPNECRGPALAGSRGYPQDERHQPERERRHVRSALIGPSLRGR